MGEDERRLIEGAAAMGLKLGSKTAQDLLVFMKELLNWNRRFNLTGLRDLDSALEKHCLDSLGCWMGGWIREGHRVVDVGSGAGIPGLVLRITAPEMVGRISVTLVESSSKKAGFLQHVCNLLDLSDVEIVVQPAEVLGRRGDFRECYDVSVSRGVAGMSVVAEYCMPLTKVNGWLLAMKGKRVVDELAPGGEAVALLGGEGPRLFEYRLPHLDDLRYIVASRKISGTPPRYPRSSGAIRKRPLGY